MSLIRVSADNPAALLAAAVLSRTMLKGQQPRPAARATRMKFIMTSAASTLALNMASR